MAVINKLLLCTVLIVCIGFVTSKTAEPLTDKQLEKVEENVVSAEADDSSEEDENQEATIVERIALFVDAYKKTAKVVEEGMERINKHVTDASKKIGKEIVGTIQKIRRDRDEL